MTPRVAALLAGMTTREKVGQVNQRLLGWRAVERTPGGFRVTDEARAEIDRWGGLGALYGLFRADAWSGRSWADGIRPEERAEAAQVVQDAVASADRHGVGALLVEEAPHGHQALGGTLLPVNLAVAAGWRPERLADAARAVAAELAASGVHVALVSALDVLRDPRWGRSEETFGEDPLLAAELTRALVEGMQGPARSRVGDDGVAVVLKHLAAQGEAVGGRNGQSAHLGPHDLAELHLPPVEAGLAAGALGFMAAYNDIDGVPCCASPELLTTYLRRERGFDGVVMADGHAVDRLEGMTGSLPAAARAALLAGVDLSLWDTAYTTLADLAADDAEVAGALDVAAGRVLALKERLGLLGEAGVPVALDAGRSVVRLERAREDAAAASQRLAADSLVLLSNRGALPWRADLRRVAVVGPWAHDVPALLGDYVPPLPAGSAASIADALRAALPDAELTVAEALAGPDDHAGAGGRVEASTIRDADAVVVVVGGTSHRSYDDAFADNGAIAGRAGQATGGEGVDLADVSLPAGQDELVRAVRDATDAPLVAVVVSGRPHVLTDVLEVADAVLWAGYPGPWGGEAVADVLTGRAEPTGHLPMTLPRHPGVVPVRHNDRQTAQDVYRDVPDPVLLPFGHGLRYRDVAVTGLEAVPGAHGVRVTATVTSRDDEPADALVRVLAHRTGGTRAPRLRELVAFGRVDVAPGATADITWDVPAARVFADPASSLCTTELHVDGLTRTVRPHVP
ncbi:glycoside hydrolase family 3 N-terminal domain-containing protein [Isoptericola cucumis]|uniref:Beta-glucosidase n=1 Tax=Isoptericola cucumis TaxID=1776856 RepID=A0ABQ2B9Z3_9MICO|nr:glycoside hydrolase family 3 N-terminal domain-containing protein [Isoptericola cucumis]GGI11525.1 beta-glucosidase [Isoptericola cucumis]